VLRLNGRAYFIRFPALILPLYIAVVSMFVAGCGQNPTAPARNRQEPPEIEPKDTADRYDLARDETRGGHTLERHVRLSDEQLEERLRRERNIAAASTWTDREIAEITVAEALRAERSRVDEWMRRGARRANLALHYDAGRVIGRSLRRGERRAVNCTRAVIVLRADGPDSFYVLTTYPEAGE
jgi:hypothetical protein